MRDQEVFSMAVYRYVRVENKALCEIIPVVGNLPANAGDTGDVDWISGSGRSPGGGNGNHSSILAWIFSWTEEPGRLQSMGSQRVRQN